MTDVSRQAALGTLAAVSPSGLGETFTITGRGLTFGRKPDCTVVISDQEISRLHATLEVDSNGRIVLTDLDSANGTYVNGRRIQTYELAPGDELIFGVSGQHRFEFFGPAEKTVALPVVRPKAHREPTVPMPPLPLERQAHLQLVVDRYTVKELSVPGDGLIVGRNPARSRYAAYFDHKSVSGAKVAKTLQT